VGVIVAVAAAAAMAVGVSRRLSRVDAPASTAGTHAPVRGGEIVAAVRAEPQSFNWYARHDMSTYVVTLLTQGKLVRVNRATQEVEPSLAESWTRSADGLQYVLKLRPGVAFSDGQPFTADDVVFSLAAAYDERGGSVLGDSMLVGGKKLEASASDRQTVVIAFPEAWGPGLRLLDNLPILPKHKLQDALAAGKIGTIWGLSTPVQEIVGLGPFTISEYLPGQRLVFARNPHYFRRDASGTALPYLDRVTVEIVPDQDTQILRLQTGASDTTVGEVRPEDYAPLKRAADAGHIQLLDLGTSLNAHTFWINLKPGAFAKDPRAAWLQRDELRQAISLAVDRQVFADTVFLGAASPIFGPISPSNKRWYSEAVPKPPHDPERAKAMLAGIGLSDFNFDGVLEDAQGRPARFALLTQKGQTALERGAFVIRDELKKVGLAVDVVPLEGNFLVQRFLSGENYDAIYFSIPATDTDPALNLDLWLSSGGAHVWNLRQKTPATDWERRIDDLMGKQTRALDEGERRRIFLDVQKTFAEHLPLVYFAAPRIYVAASARMTNLAPAVSQPQLLWSADTIAVKP
jgi:peptide/nickel transport system substrate-binding protein